MAAQPVVFHMEPLLAFAHPPPQMCCYRFVFLGAVMGVCMGVRSTDCTVVAMYQGVRWKMLVNN
eukprot:3951182-Amphidinium_carterae.2